MDDNDIAARLRGIEALGDGLSRFSSMLTDRITSRARSNEDELRGGGAGGASGTIVSIIVLAFCWGVCVIYSVVISSNLTDLLFEQGLITSEIIPGIENRQFWILATTAGILVPLCMLPNFDKLKYAAMFATSSMV